MKILIIQNRMGIGDMVIFLPFIQAISKKYNTPVTLLIKESTKAEEYIHNLKYIKEIIYGPDGETSLNYIFENPNIYIFLNS